MNRKYGVTDHLRKISVDEITWGKILESNFPRRVWQNSVLQQQKDNKKSITYHVIARLNGR